ncbi:MAG TPA: hypothetical protein VIH48_01300 [Candidatus Bathyarchaeia archaeon]
MGILDELLGFLTQGSIGGIPPLVLMIIPFIVGLIIGYFVKKLLKIAVIAIVIIAVITYFGFFGLSWGSLTGLIDTYGSQVVYYAGLLMGILPLGLGFVIGLVVGFILA